MYGTFPYVPGEVFGGIVFSGDKQAGQARRGLVLQALQMLKTENVWNLPQYSKSVQWDDGTIITVRRNHTMYTAEVFVPESNFAEEEVPRQIDLLPVLRPGQFYHIPGCKTRYFFRDKDLQNEIYIAPGSIDSSIDTINEGRGMTFLSFKDVGLLPLRPSPNGSITRSAWVCYLEGAEPNSGYSGARLNMSSYNLPTSGAYSISALVRLRKPIELDYSFTSKTKELDCGYTIWNPIKPRILMSEDGTTWSAVCPGSAAPLIGWHIPARFSTHWVRFTYPWPTYNDNFISNYTDQIGYREIDTVCDDEPILKSDWYPVSPYWDKVPFGELETLDGEFQSGWSENAENANAAPYASFCTFRVAGAHGKDPGTRVVASLSDDSKRYATVVSYIYEYNGDGTIKDTVMTLKDYQYKLYITDAQSVLTFGNQPFPVNHPQGYMIGTNFLGLLWYNGDKIIAGKICDFESEYEFPPIVTESLEIGAWYHVCLTMDDVGNCVLYLTKKGNASTTIYKSKQSVGKFSAFDGFGQALKVSIAADDWAFAPSANSQTTDYTSQFESSSYMDIATKRFYHHALKEKEAVLLSKEGFGEAFVADDSEAGALQGMGYQAVVV